MGLLDDLKARGVYTGYHKYVMSMEPILQAMSKRGLPVSCVNYDRVKEQLEARRREIWEAMQTLIPEECFPFSPPKGYKKTPKDTTGMARRWFQFDVGTPEQAAEERWVKLKPWTPSPKNLITYMKFRRHPIPSNWKTGKATTDQTELGRLAKKTKDILYNVVLEYREASTVIDNHIHNWAPSGDDRVHPTFYYETGTGQLACCAPWTPVTTKRGVMPISDIVIGDFVVTHKRRWRRVTATWIHSPKPMVDVHLSNGEVLTCTTTHRVLLSGYEHIQEMAYGRQYSNSIEDVSKQCRTDNGHHSQGFEYNYPHRELGAFASNVYGRTSSLDETSILTLKTGTKQPLVWEEGGRDTKLGGNGEGWLRVSDLSCGRKESVRSSTHNGSSVGTEDPSQEIRCTPYKWRHRAPRTEQSSLGNEVWSHYHSLTSARGLEECKVEKIISVGCFPVHDISVEEDESYESCGIFSHNSRRPNVQNAPKHKKATADIFRSMVEAPDGYTILSFDYKSFHAQTLAFEATDKDYLRLAKLDIHSFLTAYLVRENDRDRLLALPDMELADRLASIRARHPAIRDQQAKRAILGYGFGMGWKKLYMLNQESFENQAEAKRVMETLNGLFPRACKWRDEIRMKAHEQGFLMSRAGCIRWFWEVFKWDGSRLVPGGDDSEAAIAFLPANDAFCHIKDAMLRLERGGQLEKYNLINQIHDDLMFICPDDLVGEAIAEIRMEMERASDILIDPVVAPTGLSIEVGVSKGKRWDLMTKV